MTKTITIHSHKGGSGKTICAINMGAILVEMGYRVVVLDLDLNGPSLQTYAPNRTEKTLNDLFLHNTDIEDIIFDATYLMNEPLSGKLFMGLSDISGDVISKMGQRNKDSLLNDLYQLMGVIKNQLPDNPWNADYILIDTPPGLSTTSINGVAAADHLLLLMRLVNADLNGTYQFLKTIHKALKPKSSIVVNQVPKSFIEKNGEEPTEKLINNRIIRKISKANIDFLGIIQNDEEVINSELEYAFMEGDSPIGMIPRPIHYVKDPKSSFSRSLFDITKKILEIA